MNHHLVRSEEEEERSSLRIVYAEARWRDGGGNGEGGELASMEEFPACVSIPTKELKKGEGAQASALRISCESHV